jgi:hypothetical protein
MSKMRVLQLSPVIEPVETVERDGPQNRSPRN